MAAAYRCGRDKNRDGEGVTSKMNRKRYETPMPGKSTGFDYEEWTGSLDKESLKRVMQTYYDERAEEYIDWFLRTGLYDRPETNEPFLRGLRELEEVVEAFGAGRVLDIACGIGWWTSLLARHATGVVALDYAPGMLRECRRRLALNGVTVDLVRGSAYQLPYADDTFDGAFIGLFVSHVPREDVAAFLTEVGRVVRPGGRVLIVDSTLPELDDVQEELQKRPLRSGATYPALKVYYGEAGLSRALAPFAQHLRVRTVESLFVMATYRVPGAS